MGIGSDGERADTDSGPTFWDGLRTLTQARIGLGRAGDALPTRQVLEFATAHARARDAVHTALDVAVCSARVAALGLGEPVHVPSRARDRAEYLRRPDLGRLPSAGSISLLPGGGRNGPAIGMVLADGLSARALTEHGPPLLGALMDLLRPRYSIAVPVVATQARVALGDHIGAALGVTTVLVLIGERPGLSVADSLGIYLTHRPRPGVTDADRNCVSNIHPPQGLDYRRAAEVTAGLIAGAHRLGRSGVELKDMSRDPVLPGPTATLDDGGRPPSARHSS
ncbi:ethanolamine ammonia-lyase subunit EutC [Nocardia speluncae]|uniref:Ethanolamine ammonia-lyase small subunit n=1 Tax=Nocardia speluncae TaxID=419477 RepID=A0A846XCH9_9NOCA|nr:ethanolamine ammonia-lyase subunit EutC [Nocardia speluncae]NKY32849.1 ethanolamine ammonia-lyase subunit EutC [Nocardia speluncae]